MKTFLLLLLVSASAFALEVDEKLTVRILKATDSRKTLMVNRGTEDGLVEGDHARFIVTAGIVARAVCAKVSPTRSIWSVYRLVNADFIVNDAVMTLKITPPVKITRDESQTIVEEDTPTRPPTDPNALGIPLADGAQDLTPTGEEKIDTNDLRSLEDVTIVERNFEVFGIINISGLSARTKATGTETYRDSFSYHHIGLGGEYYPQREREWYSRFSLLGGLNFMRLNSQPWNGGSVTNDVTEFQGGVHWHPGNMPSTTYRFIPFFHLSLGVGTARSTVRATDADRTSERVNGNTSSFALGFGYKFYTQKGFGARAMIDYYTRNERYKKDFQELSWNRSTSGPRFMLGLSYRF